MRKSTKWHKQVNVDMYGGLHRNLSLWSVKPNVSRILVSEDRHIEKGIISIWGYLSIF